MCSAVLYTCSELPNRDFTRMPRATREAVPATGCRLVTAWSLPGHCLVTAWSLPGHCLDTAWTLPGHCLDTGMPGTGSSMRKDVPPGVPPFGMFCLTLQCLPHEGEDTDADTAGVAP